MNFFIFFKRVSEQVNLIHGTPAYGKIWKNAKSLHPTNNSSDSLYNIFGFLLFSEFFFVILKIRIFRFLNFRQILFFRIWLIHNPKNRKINQHVSFTAYSCRTAGDQPSFEPLLQTVDCFPLLKGWQSAAIGFSFSVDCQVNLSLFTSNRSMHLANWIPSYENVHCW